MGLVAATAGCKKTVEQEIAAIAPAITPKLDRALALAPQLATFDRNKSYTGPALGLVESVDKQLKGDTVMIYASDLQQIDHVESSKVRYRVYKADSLSECFWAIRKKQWGSRPTLDGELGDWKSEPIKAFQVPILCEELAQAKYLAVISQDNVVLALVDPMASGEAKNTFDAGKVHGILLIFDLTSGAYLGAKRYEAGSSGVVSYTVKVDKHGNQEASLADVAAIQKDLSARVAKVIEATLAGKTTAP